MPDTSKHNTLPLALIGLAVLAVVGAGAYLLFARSAPQSVATSSTSSTSTKSVTVPASPASATTSARPIDPSAVVAGVAPVIDNKVTPVAPSVPTTAPALEPPLNAAASAALTDVGVVMLDIKPWGNIVVDGIAKGASPPMKRLPLPPGTHTIEIRNPAGPTVSRTVEVVAGKSVPLRHTF